MYIIYIHIIYIYVLHMYVLCVKSIFHHFQWPNPRAVFNPDRFRASEVCFSASLCAAADHGCVGHSN